MSCFNTKKVDQHNNYVDIANYYYLQYLSLIWSKYFHVKNVKLSNNVKNETPQSAE